MYLFWKVILKPFLTSTADKVFFFLKFRRQVPVKSAIAKMVKKFRETSIEPLGRSGQRPELSQATGMALIRCILGKFLGVVCH